MNDQTPLPYRVAVGETIHCIGRTAELLMRHRIHQPSDHVGMRLQFADGTSAPVYRETVMDDGSMHDPCLLVVAFRLRFVRGWGHALFRAESELNTPLFVGYPGFVSKLWLAHDQHGVYRGVYQWDGPEQAEHYARSLWRVLALASVPGSIHYRVLPNLRRDVVLATPHLLDADADAMAPHDAEAEAEAWWKLVAAA